MSDPSETLHLTTEQRLLLHQLRLLEWMQEQERKESASVSLAPNKADEEDALIPARWELTRGVNLYPWQTECIERWFRAGRLGTVKVVTGGGKTLLGLAIAQKLQNEVNRHLRLAVVVPTVVLMHQWYDELIERGNLPPHAIGRLGGGYKDDFKDRRVFIAVLASAHKQLPALVRSARNGKHLLLIADECHRAGATEMSRVFRTQRGYSLGLSATPERDEDEEEGEVDAGYEASVLGQELGPIIYDFTLKQALELGVVPRFTIRHYGLPLTPEEQARYDSLSRSISETQSELRPLAPQGRTSGPGFYQWARGIAGKGDDGSELASKLIIHISRRKELLQGMSSRAEAVEALLRDEFSVNPETRAILFHESIAEVMKLFVRMQRAGFRAIAEHSRLPDSVREEGLDLFRSGIAQVIVSARSLIEGFNVPAVDVGIIVASSGSVRQRIQSLGRVLRKHRGRDGEEKTSVVHVLYARDTVDDHIYGKLNWEQTTGVEQNLYYLWDVEGKPELREGPPRSPLPGETDIDVSELKAGDEYPGMYEGVEYTCDTRGNIQDPQGTYASNPGELAAEIQRVKGGAGRFRITARRGYVLVRVPRGDEWVTLYVTGLHKPLDFASPEPPHEAAKADPATWAQGAAPGDSYPFGDVPMKTDDIVFKRKRGGVLTRRVKSGEVFARVGAKAEDPRKGAAAERLLGAIQELGRQGKQVSKLEINELGHVLHRERGRLVFVGALQGELEFPRLDD